MCFSNLNVHVIHVSAESPFHLCTSSCVLVSLVLVSLVHKTVTCGTRKLAQLCKKVSRINFINVPDTFPPLKFRTEAFSWSTRGLNAVSVAIVSLIVELLRLSSHDRADLLLVLKEHSTQRWRFSCSSISRD